MKRALLPLTITASLLASAPARAELTQQNIWDSTYSVPGKQCVLGIVQQGGMILMIKFDGTHLWGVANRTDWTAPPDDAPQISFGINGAWRYGYKTTTDTKSVWFDMTDIKADNFFEDLRNSNSIWVGFPGSKEKSWNISSNNIQPAMKDWTICIKIMADTMAKTAVPTPPPAIAPTNGKGAL